MKRYLIVIFIVLSCNSNAIDYEKALVELELKQGVIKLAFYYKDCPNHVKNFLNLVNNQFYDGTTFHRVEYGYLIQGGDFKSKNNSIFDDGMGELDYTIISESKYRHFKGAIAMAKKPAAINPDNRSNACQFYIALDSLTNLDEEYYTVFGYVLDGFETLDSLQVLPLHQGTNPNSAWNKVTEMKARIVYE